MATRNENLDRIRNAVGSYSPGTKNTTQMNGPRYEETSRDESLRILQSALSGGTATQGGTGPAVTQPEITQPEITQPTVPSTSSGAVVPPSPQGEGLSAQGKGRSAEQVQQEKPLTAADYDKLIREKEARLAELENEWRYKNNYTYEEKQAYLKEKNDIKEQIEALYDSLSVPNTNAERDSLIRRMNEITANEGYATTVELADAVTQEKQETRQRLHQLDEELGNAARFYDSGERASAVVKGAVKQTGSAYTNFMGTLQGVGNRLHESSSTADQAVAGSDYAGWATDELTAANMAQAIMKENPDGNYLEGLQKEEQRLYEKADAIAESAAKDIGQAKEGLSALGRAGVDISVNLIQNGIDAAGKAAGLGMLPFFVRAAGSASMEARHEGASTWQQVFYAVPKAAIEVATELISGGIAGTGVSGLDKVVEPLIGKLAKSTAGKIALNAIYDAAMEGTEEVISDLLGPFVKLVYNDQALKEAWENRAEFGAQMLYDYLIGAVVGSIGSGTKILTGAATGERVKTVADTQDEAQTGQEQTAQPAAEAQAKPYQTVEELIQPIQPAGNTSAVEPAAATTGSDYERYAQQVQSGRAEFDAMWEVYMGMVENAAVPEHTPGLGRGYGTPRAIDLGDGVTLYFSPAFEGSREGTFNIVGKDGTELANSLFYDYDLGKIFAIAENYSTRLQDERTRVKKEIIHKLSEMRKGRNAEIPSSPATGDNTVRETAEATPQPAGTAASSPYTGEPTTPQSAAVAPTAPTRGAMESTPVTAQQEAQVQAAEESPATEVYAAKSESNTAEKTPPSVLYNMRSGKNGWDKAYGTAMEALNDAVQYVDPGLWDAIKSEGGDSNENIKYGTFPMVGALTAVQEEVRGEQITPMQGAKLLSEAYKQGGAGALKSLYNPRNGNLYEQYLEQAKQYTASQTAETAQDAQMATPQAETPPAAQNAPQTAPGELNTQAETNTQGQGTIVQRNTRRTGGEEAERGFSKNVATDSAMETALREDIAKNPDLYKRLSNKDTLKKAQDIFSQGIDTARSELERAIGAAQSGQKLAPEMVPLSRMVANELTRRGELEAARKIISDVAAELTSAGQLGQAGAILRNADPMTVLNTLQKAIDQINAEMARKFGKRNPWTAELTEEEIKQISETDFSQDGAFEAIQQQIAKRLGREMPATWLEKATELRKVGMLANPKTQIKNVAGNVPLAVERKVAEKLSGGLQELAVKAGIMSKEEQTRTLRVSKESKDLAKSVYENNIDRITRKGNKGELRGILKDTRTYFNKGLLQKGIEKATGHQLDDAALDYVRRFTYECMEKGDAPFVKSAFIDSLAQYCEAQGIKSEADVTETAISYAIDQAMAATFKDASALANLLNSIKDNAGIAGQALDVLLPFTTTPINIANEFYKYSPLGYLQLLNAKGKGSAEVIDIISRATTGRAVVALGILLRGLGFITGAADDDKDKAAADRAAGISPYSFGGKYSYEWMQPTGSALAMGAEIYDSVKDGGSLIEAISNGIISAGDAYLEQSFYKDIIDLFQGYGSPTENVIRELLTGTASQFVPTIVGATARTIDPTVRTSYTGGNIIDDILAQAKVKTPGLSKSAPASVNVKGEEIQRGNLLERILDNFIFPWTTNRNGGDGNAVDQAIDEVYEETGDKTIFRKVSPYKVSYKNETYQMTGEEREQFQKTQGQVHDDIIQQIIDGTLWQEMDNDAKVKTMQLANEYALDAAKRELVESRGDEYSSDWDEEAELSDVGNYLAAKTTLKSAQGSKDYTLLDALIDTVSEQKKDVQGKLNKDFSMLDELIYGKENGVGSKEIYTAKEKADVNGNGSVTQEEMWNYLETQVIMPSSKKSVLWDILTSGTTGYAEYAGKQK